LLFVFIAIAILALIIFLASIGALDRHSSGR